MTMEDNFMIRDPESGGNQFLYSLNAFFEVKDRVTFLAKEVMVMPLV
jgi:hypothetical protein